MDLYLPIDFYQLRDDLPDWRDAPPTTHDDDSRCARADAAARDGCADPQWKVF